MKTSKCSWKHYLKLKCLSSAPVDDVSSASSICLPVAAPDMLPIFSAPSPTKTQVPSKMNGELSLVVKNQNGNVKKIRNKVDLKPGRSLMDWIRLGTSGKDLTGVGGQFLEVTGEELAKHNKKDDAWIAVKGRVYNVTDYAEFHPGGVDELEKGWGKDATKLFMQAHSWVNFEAMLKKCIVGRLVPFTILPIVSSEINKKETSNLQVALKNSLEISSPENISYDWYQSDKNVILIIYTRWLNIKPENVILDILENKQLLVTLNLEKITSYVHIDLEQHVTLSSEILIAINGKIEIILSKTKHMKWEQLGVPLNLNKLCKPTEEIELNYRSCRLLSKTSVTKNTFLFTFEFLEGSKMIVPMAKHVSIRLKIKSEEIDRSYTPIPKTLADVEENMVYSGKNLCFMIKVYDDGLLTPCLNNLKIGDYVEISDYFGTMTNSSPVHNCKELILLAAGTGITPMLSILYHLLVKDEKRNTCVHLMFFNKTQDDILWKEQLDMLTTDKRFKIVYVLSEPRSDWEGPSGRVSLSLLQEFVPSADRDIYFCICGPTSFNHTCSSLLNQMGYENGQVHVFPNN